MSVPTAIVFGIGTLVRGDVRFTTSPGALGTILDVALATLIGAAAGLVWGAARYMLGRKRTRAA